MKNKFIWAAAAAILVSCSKLDAGDTLIRFNVDNITASEAVILIDRTANYTVDLDKNGRGEIVLHNVSNLYPRIAYGQQALPVFIGKGESVTLSFDGIAFGDGIIVSGPNAAASEYLQNVMLPEPPQYNLEPQAFIAAIDDCVAEGIEAMKARQLDSKCPDFFEVEKQRLSYLYGQSLLMYQMGHAMMTDQDDYVPTAEIYDAVRALCVDNEALQDVDIYRMFVQYAAPMLLEEKGISVTSNVERTAYAMKYVGRNFTNENVKQNLIRTFAIDYFTGSGSNGTEDIQAVAKNYLTIEKYKEEYLQSLKENNPTAPENLSPDFEGKDINGKSYSLADFKGKYIYIDIWATWCPPCKQQLPYFKALTEKFAGKNIVFLGLSVDQDKAKWEKAVRSGVLAGTQLHIGPENDFLEQYGVSGIPRFILLDQNGCIINANMLRPSSEDTERILSQLENL